MLPVGVLFAAIRILVLIKYITMNNEILLRRLFFRNLRARLARALVFGKTAAE